MYRNPSSVPVRSGGNSRNGERNGGVPFSISGTGTASSVPYAVPDGPGRPKLPKKATVPGFGAPRTARPFQIRNFRNGNGERPFRPTRSVPDGVPGRNWVIYRQRCAAMILPR